MSIFELEAQIDAVFKEIERQKQVLRTLESDKSLLQRKLNAVRDPISRLPLEISSKIFVQCLPSSSAIPDGHQVPMLLLNVCNAWTDIALSTPALWMKIHFSLPRNEGFGRLLARWLGRAQPHLLHVSVKGLMDKGLATQIFGHFDRLGHLELSAEDGEDAHDDFFLEFRDFLRGTLPESWPVLHTLVLRSGRRTLQISASPILRVLRHAPNLTELVFHAVDTVGGMAQDLVLLSNLRRLSLAMQYQQYVGSQSKILGYISAPQLATLFISHDLRASTEDNRNIVAFLERSSPPLQTLIIANASDPGCVNDILPLVPTLTDLRIECPGSDVLEEMSTLLGQTPPTAVPNLRALRLTHLDFRDIETWDAVVHALSARRTLIKTLRMEFRYSEIPIPPDAFTVLKELSAEGMDIWIGVTESERNEFLDV